MSAAVGSKLSSEERRTLLMLARAAIAERFDDDGRVERLLRTVELSPGLEIPRATFVTLRETTPGLPATKGRLRGCIGTMVAREPLYLAVIRTAQSSAFEDPRFPAVTAGDLERITLEISALSPPVSVDGPEDVVPGRDGVQMEKQGHRAVFLPQVATEQGWSTRDLLENLALKAGLPRDGWRRARLEIFQAEVFGDADQEPHHDS